MKKWAGIVLLCTIIWSCTKHPTTVAEKMLLGRWVTTDQRYNREWFSFRDDYSFKDTRYGASPIKSPPNPVAFSISGNNLMLKYKWMYSIRFTTSFRIITLDDSTLIIATRASSRYPSRTYHLKKMKLNGKFIGG